MELEEGTLGYQDNAGGRETILVVEDDQLVRKSLVLFIRSLGYSVLDAGSAEEALDCSMREPISLLLTDLHLPARNGLELAGALRARGTTVPVVLLSGYLNEQAQIQAKQVGINAFLRKPTDLPLLERTLLGVFNKMANMQ